MMGLIRDELSLKSLDEIDSYVCSQNCVASPIATTSKEDAIVMLCPKYALAY